MTEQHQSAPTESTDEHSRLCESLSALMDNHSLSELELQRLLKQSVNLTSTWNRYHIASASLRRDLHMVAPVDFAARVSAAIAAEDTQNTQIKSRTQKPWLWTMGRVAVAASVAGLLVVGVQQYSSLDSADTALVADNKTTHLPSGINVPSLPARTVAVQSGYQTQPQDSLLQDNPRLQEKARINLVPIQQMSSADIEDINRYLNQLVQERNNPTTQTTGPSAYKRVILVEDNKP
jgi:sigma-E factor negative regulatory protein RseA